MPHAVHVKLVARDKLKSIRGVIVANVVHRSHTQPRTAPNSSFVHKSLQQSATMPETRVHEKQALQSNRMISVQEQNIRKGVAAALFALTSSIVWFRGIANSSPVCVSFFFASAMTFLITGIYNQCGCALRLRWAVSEGGRPFKDRVPVPTQHIQFMKAKRRGILANLAASATFGVLLGAGLFATQGLLTKPVCTKLLYGAATHITVMTVLSLTS